jgi:hypothetical protein
VHERALRIELLEEACAGLPEELRHTHNWHSRKDVPEKQKTSLALLATPALPHSPGEYSLLRPERSV